ncbi:sugar ABC transporter permease [Streptomyces thermolineatus]|uniref:Sugar ABC transporter permease n=1 Tax=Streptomyces thermolineatus TaxID=44033 RepID=A0ABN3KTZ3_9ACTN
MSAADTSIARAPAGRPSPAPGPDPGSAPPGKPHGRGRGRGPRRDPAWAPWLLLAPTLLVLALVLGYPLVRLLVISFRQYGQAELWQGLPGDWQGLANYTHILTDGAFWSVVLRTLLFTLAAVTLTMTVGMAVALLLQRVSTWVKVLVNIVLVASWSMPVVVAITVFKWMFDSDYGVLNWLFSRVPGVDLEGHNWFTDSTQGLAVIVLLVVWGAVPFVAITLHAGLTQVPKELEEAARLDGAGPVKVFRHVTVPVLKPVIVMLTTLSVIWDMGVFPQVFLMRDGHPEPEYQVLTTYSYDQAFVVNDYDAGAAIAVVTVLLLLGVMAVYMRQMLKIGEVE